MEGTIKPPGHRVPPTPYCSSHADGRVAEKGRARNVRDDDFESQRKNDDDFESVRKNDDS